MNSSSQNPPGAMADDLGASPSRSETLIEFLRRPTSFPDLTGSVQVIETHISWVFLTDRYAYKLKKPVHFEFLDFRQLAQRHAACETEVRLNRRLAPDTYLGVVPVSRDRRGRWQFGGTGQPEDYLVRMRRLPATESLDVLIRDGRIGRRQVDQLARRLIGFYRELPPLPLPTEDYRRSIERHIRANGDELLRATHQLPRQLVARCQSAQLRLLLCYPEWWDARVCDGRVMEGHGDLRPEHVFFHPHPLIIDAIEFSSELRRIDVLDELGFLAMECAQLGAAWVGDEIIGQYRVATGDRAPEPLLRFYEAYRASVRAKVAALRALQLPDAERLEVRAAATRYLEWAESRIKPWCRPLLIVVSGLSGTGKSALAAQLAASLACPQLATDAIRRECQAAARPRGEYGAAGYALDQRELVYHELFAQADELLGQGVSVILDGTFLKRTWLEAAVTLAARRQADVAILHCDCPAQVAADRVAERQAAGSSLSEISAGLLQQQRHEQELPAPFPGLLTVDTTQSLPDLMRAIFGHLRALNPLTERACC